MRNVLDGAQFTSLRYCYNCKKVKCKILYFELNYFQARVSWVGEAGQGFSLEYPHVAMHAVQKDLSVFPHENLYLIIGKEWIMQLQFQIYIRKNYFFNLDCRLVDSDGTPSPTSTPSGSDIDDGDDPVHDEDQGMTEIR